MASFRMAALAAAASMAAAVVASSAALPSAIPGGNLVGVFRLDGVCTLVSLNPATGVNTSIAALTVCDGVDQLFPASSAYDAANSALLLAIGAGPSLFSIDVATGKTTALAPLPAYNDSNWIIGVQVLAGTPYVVTQTAIYALSGGALKDTGVALNVPQYSQVAGGLDGNGVPVIYIADENSKALYVASLASPPPPVATLSSGVSSTILLQYSASRGKLVELASYTLYATDPKSGKSSRIGAVPDGPGYPRVNALSPDGTTLAIIDFADVFTMNLATGAVSAKQPFTAAPRVVGFPQWVPA
jgi:hypothetical protein